MSIRKMTTKDDELLIKVWRDTTKWLDEGSSAGSDVYRGQGNEADVEDGSPTNER